MTSPVSNVYAVRLRTEGEVFEFWISRSQAAPTQTEPKLWVRRADAEKALRYAIFMDRQFGGGSGRTDSTAAVVEFELREVQR